MTAMGSPIVTTANSVIGMWAIETARAEMDVRMIVSPIVKARISAGDMGRRFPAIRARAQYPIAKKAAIASRDRIALGGETTARIAYRARTATARPMKGKVAPLVRGFSAGNIADGRA